MLVLCHSPPRTTCAYKKKKGQGKGEEEKGKNRFQKDGRLYAWLKNVSFGNSPSPPAKEGGGGPLEEEGGEKRKKGGKGGRKMDRGNIFFHLQSNTCAEEKHKG